ncbi:MAG: hypothetical protein A4E63_01892 [Syntrophorhabdus sp. PtaU1.Bin050]|jgi:uncharacterized membrane protein YjfL (UPF0719 family)|nr:MAG: hypothetical protein A4E63_01892 [Syntrophorhabdus sp. PtaU1.Bin050]
MWNILGNATEMFVYSAVYVLITLVSVKVVGAIFTSDFEKRISDEGNVALSIICASVFIGLALLLSSVVR